MMAAHGDRHCQSTAEHRGVTGHARAELRGGRAGGNDRATGGGAGRVQRNRTAERGGEWGAEECRSAAEQLSRAPGCRRSDGEVKGETTAE